MNEPGRQALKSFFDYIAEKECQITASIDELEEGELLYDLTVQFPGGHILQAEEIGTIRFYLNIFSGGEGEFQIYAGDNERLYLSQSYVVNPPQEDEEEEQEATA